MEPISISLGAMGWGLLTAGVAVGLLPKEAKIAVGRAVVDGVAKTGEWVDDVVDEGIDWFSPAYVDPSTQVCRPILKGDLARLWRTEVPATDFKKTRGPQRPDWWPLAVVAGGVGVGVYMSRQKHTHMSIDSDEAKAIQERIKTVIDSAAPRCANLMMDNQPDPRAVFTLGFGIMIFSTYFQMSLERPAVWPPVRFDSQSFPCPAGYTYNPDAFTKETCTNMAWAITHIAKRMVLLDMASGITRIPDRMLKAANFLSGVQSGMEQFFQSLIDGGVCVTIN